MEEDLVTLFFQNLNQTYVLHIVAKRQKGRRAVIHNGVGIFRQAVEALQKFVKSPGVHLALPDNIKEMIQNSLQLAQNS